MCRKIQDELCVVVAACLSSLFFLVPRVPGTLVLGRHFNAFLIIEVDNSTTARIAVRFCPERLRFTG